MRQLEIPILEIVVFVHITKDICLFLSKYGKSVNNTVLACTFYDDDDPERCPQVVFAGKPTNKTIAHEVVHITNMIFNKKGIIPDLDNDEFQAYLSAFIFEQIKNVIK